MGNQGGSGSDQLLGTLETVVVEFGRLIEPLAVTAEKTKDGDKDAVEHLLNDIGIPEANVDAVETVIIEVVGPWETIYDNVLTPLAKGNKPTPDGIAKSTEALVDFFDGINKLSNVDAPKSKRVDDIAIAFTDYLIAQYLKGYYPQIFAALALTGIIDDPPGSEPATVDLTTISEVVEKPDEVLKTTLEWGTPEFKTYAIINHLGQFARTYTQWATIEPNDTYTLTEAEGNDPNLRNQLNVPIVSLTSGGASARFGTKLAPVPPTSSKYHGISLVPYAQGSFDQTFSLGTDWEFKIDADAQTADMGVVAQPNKSGDVDVEVGRLRDDHQGGSLISDKPPGGSLKTALSLGYKKSPGEPSKMLLGNRETGGLMLRQLMLKGVFEADTEGAEVKAELPTKARLTIKPSGGFLEKIMPPKITTDFEMIPGYSTAQGFYFDGSVKLKVPIPINESLGPITLKEIYIEVALDLDTGNIEPLVAVSADGKLGPIDTTVKRVGVDGLLEFPEKRDGNLGVADLATKFSPPDGAGLSLDTGPVSGGGYIEYDPENERYAGVFQVKIGPVNVKIMGLLTTEFPDGSDGFSLLLSVFGEFPPVQLSFGFTLNGLGGVIGVNRSLRPKPLGKAVRSGNMGSVLFPEDPVANAQRIVSDLRSIYPPTRGQHVFGPMARFGWGTPSQILLDLGVVLQLPKFKIVILGKLTVGLPQVDMPKQSKIITLNLAVMGSVEPQKQMLRVTASLYDSRVMIWSVKGDMAMRTRWGNKPRFLLGVGGFNPRFPVPSDFPKLTQVTISISLPVPTPTVEWKGYFATTSNTVQVGASFKAKFEAGPVSAKAWWGLDALFQFKPFKFVVDFEAGVKVSVFGMSLSVSMNGTLKGPSPVHINGKLKVETPGMLPDPSPKVSITIGEEKSKDDQLPVANLLPEFKEALTDPANWSVQMPEGGEGIVSLRDRSEEDGVLAHPMGKPSVRQTIVPVGREIERYDKNRPKHTTYDFSIAPAASAENLPNMQSGLKEEFAPAKYKNMSDSEKLNAPAFKRWDAGKGTGNDLFYWGCEVETNGTTKKPQNAASARLGYEHKQHDAEIEAYLGGDASGNGSSAAASPAGGYPVDVARSLADGGAVANADTRWTGEKKFVPVWPDEDPVSIQSNLGDIDGSVGVIEDVTLLDEPEGMTGVRTGSALEVTAEGFDSQEGGSP